jgi:OOP family OmpA-OmpF porin
MLMRGIIAVALTASMMFIVGCSSTPKEEVIAEPVHQSTSPQMTFKADEDDAGLNVPTYFEDGMADKDHDGIEDAKDRCVDTPIGVDVDSDGCAFDRDQDGVKDYEDECQNTMAYAKVKVNGCADFVSFNLYYAPRVNEITPKSMLVLEKSVGFLKEHPEYKVKITGHTDNIGDDAYNLKLSKDRAEDVLKIFNRKGVNFKRLEATGKGELEPLESNDTDEGRALNRRIEVELYL